jgi:hypothetical protein
MLSVVMLNVAILNVAAPHVGDYLIRILAHLLLTLSTVFVNQSKFFFGGKIIGIKVTQNRYKKISYAEVTRGKVGHYR